MKETVLCKTSELDIKKTFDCGQCFRWNPGPDGFWYGVAYGHAARVREQDGFIYILSDAEEAFWREYFDLGRDYARISAGFECGEYVKRCVEYGRGIRILRQEPWEALCSFIISQCNNIPRIKGIVEKLCSLYGEKISFEGLSLYTFPTYEKIAALTVEDLAPLRSGYRAEYILNAAQALSSGELKLEKLINTDWVTAKKTLLSLKGVGEKVANCVVLFGLYHMEAFPVDVWIKRALKEHFPPDFDPASIGPYAGLLQQYIFYYARSTNNS